MKKFSKVKRIFTILLIFLFSINSFAAVKSDNDGSAFITKAEFDSLKNNFQAQIDTYNRNIDSKIDNAIAGYLQGVTFELDKQLGCPLNQLSSQRRTFVGKINVPTSSGQNNLAITTNGFWGASTINEGLSKAKGNTTVHGYMFIGLNNYTGGHAKKPTEASNGQSGKYCFIDKGTVNNQDYWYLRDDYTQSITLKIFSWYACVEYGIDYGKWSSKANTTSITWSATDSWVGTNYRPVGKNASGTTKTFPALETITLNTSKDSQITWSAQSTGDVVQDANCGSLTKDDQYNWTYDMTNQHYGNAASQCFTTATDPNYCSLGAYNEGTHYLNSYNPGTEYFNLNFKVPKITMLPMTNLCQNDTSIISGVPTKYYNGLPLCDITKQGKLKVKFTLKRSNTAGVVDVAIAREQFKNYAITSDSATDIIYRNTIAASDTRWGGTKDGTFEIEIDADKTIDAVGKTLWMKCYCHNGSTAYTVELSVDEIIQSYSS